MTEHLPKFIRPMLATAGAPFDSDDHLFEIKWDGLRTSVYVEGGAHRLMSRRGEDMTQRYPELSPLAQLPDGTVLDGELVVLDGAGKPSFRAVLSRLQARSSLRVRQAANATPVTLIVFDQLYTHYQPVVSECFQTRRERLLETVDSLELEHLVASDGVIGPGRAYFEQVVAQELEGLVAKRLDSRYSAGKRSDAWIKMRKRSSILCAVIGYVPKGGDDFESLILASDDEGALRCVGRVGTGFDAALRKQLNALLRSRHSQQPLIECAHAGQWLEAGLYCSVAFLERTQAGELREPVFERLIQDP